MNVALAISLYLAISENKKLNEYAEFKLHNHIVEAGKQLEMVNIINDMSIKAIDEEEYSVILNSYTTFAYEYAAIEELAETLGKISKNETNHSAIFDFKNELHFINVEDELSDEDEEFLISFKSFIKDLNEDLNKSFKRFEIQEYNWSDKDNGRYKLEIKGEKEISDFDYELEINRDYWIEFIKSVTDTNEKYKE